MHDIVFLKIPCALYVMFGLLRDYLLLSFICLSLSSSWHAVAFRVPLNVCSASYVVFMILQGPLGCQSFSGFPLGEALLHREIDLFISTDVHAEISAISWEATIQRHIEEELHGPSLEV